MTLHQIEYENLTEEEKQQYDEAMTLPKEDFISYTIEDYEPQNSFGIKESAS